MNRRFEFRPEPGTIPPDRSLVAAEKEQISPIYFVAATLVYISYASPLFGVWLLWNGSHLDWFEYHGDFFNGIYLLSFVFWVYIFPIRKRFGNGEARLIYNILPIIVYLGVMFAQYHSFSAYLLLCCWAIWSFSLWAKIPNKGDPAMNQRLKTRFYRRSVSLLVALFLIPSVVGVVLENRRASFELLYQNLSDEYCLNRIESSASTSSKEKVYEETADVFLRFSQKEWNSSEPQERLKDLQALSIVECRVLGIPFGGLKTLYSAELPDNCLGIYNHKENSIYIQAALINAAKPEAAVKTLLHELYHYYQWYLVQQLDLHDAFTDAQYFDQLRIWKANFEHYDLDELSFDGYQQMPLEESARDFAEAEVKVVMRYAGNLNN